jgi:formylmethanofuran dehydrogenase subunit B
MAVCTGCSLLCDDIELSIKDGAFAHVKNLCRRGHGHFQSIRMERTSPMVDGIEVSLDLAIKEAAKMIGGADSPLLYGWANSSLDAQAAGIDLAKNLGAVIDVSSPYCHGLITEQVLKGELPTCSLDDVRNFADTSVFLGSDPSNSHPRLLSRFAYYPRGAKRQKTYEEERTCMAVDVRKSATAKLCGNYFRVVPGGDAEFISSIESVLDGKIPKLGDRKRLIEFGTILRKTEFGVVFPGLGFISSLRDTEPLLSLILKLNEVSAFKVIPMVEHCNARGFNQLLMERAGSADRVSFKGGEVRSGREHGVIAAARSSDLAIVVGSDPLSSLPFGAARNLCSIVGIAIDPHRSLTTDAARVVIPSAIYGLEAGGTAVRMDGAEVRFEPVVESELLSDGQILARIKEEI